MKKFFATALVMNFAIAGVSFAQDDITPFWRAVDSLNLGNAANDLYDDLSLLDTIKIGGETFSITWKSSDTLFLSHDGHINGRFVGENKEVTLTATVHDGMTDKKQDVSFKVSIHGYEPYSSTTR